MINLCYGIIKMLYKGGKMTKNKSKKHNKDYRIILQFPSTAKSSLDSEAASIGLRPSQYIKMKILKELQHE